MKVSVCTSVLNQSTYLKRMIESVRAQTLTDWELIIVDDGSTEPVKELVEGFHDTRIVYVRWDNNVGIPHGLNHAFSLAKGEYVQPLSADEWITPDKLETQAKYLDGNLSVDCVWGLPGKGEMGERPTWEQYALRAHNRSRQGWIKTLLMMEQIPIGGASMLMRTSVMTELGGFDPEFFHCSDLELFVRFFQGHDGMVLPYRWADADQPADRLTAPSPDNAIRFQQDVKKLHVKHQIVLPPQGRVTVGIPVKNMAHMIRKALNSLRKQTVQDFDIIVWDDGSTDDLAAALEGYEDRIQFFRVEESLGIARTVNQLAARCATEFFVSLAADDWLEPTFIERCLKEFAADPFLEFVASQTDFYDKDCKALPPMSNPVHGIERAANKPREQWLQRLYYGNVYFGAGMYRVEALLSTGGFDSAAGVLMDYDKYLALLQRNNIKVIEENLTHTRIHDGNASMGPGKFTQQWLKEKYSEIRRRYYQPRMKVIIATPFYELRGFSPYISSLSTTIQLLTKYGIEHQFWELSGDSYVDRAKNTLFCKFLEDPDNTDLFMIDSDMQWDPMAVINMLQQPEEILMGSYPQKNMWDVWTVQPEMQQQGDKQFPVGRNLPDGSAILKAAFLAGGFLRVKRSALEKYRDHYSDLTYYDPAADPGCPERKYTEFFTCERAELNGTMMRWGEDRVFGKRMKEIGIDGWIYPRINIGHYGVKGWTGNFHDHLTAQSAKTQAGAPVQ